MNARARGSSSSPTRPSTSAGSGRSVTECLALQEGVRLAVRLGLDEPRARALMGAELDRRLAERSVIRAAYALPTGCKDGGSLDLHRDDPRFP